MFFSWPKGDFNLPKSLEHENLVI